jgi:hypothetical protein
VPLPLTCHPGPPPLQASTGRSLVTGLPLGFMADLQWLLATAYDKHGLLVTVSLWSHDILAVRRGNGVGNRARAVLLMSDDAATDAYIQRALLPMLMGLDARMRPGGPSYLDAVVAWEVSSVAGEGGSWWYQSARHPGARAPTPSGSTCTHTCHTCRCSTSLRASRGTGAFIRCGVGGSVWGNACHWRVLISRRLVCFSDAPAACC